VELYIASDEEAIRKAYYPTIHERIDLQRDWVKEQLKDARMASQREAIKRLADKKLEEAREKTRKTKEEQRNAKMLSKGKKPQDVDEKKDEVKDSDEDDDDGSLAILEDALQEATEELDEDDDENSSVAEQRRRQDKQTFMADLLEIKEKKVLASRDTAAYHREISPYQAYSKAAWFALGWRAANSNEVGSNDRDVTLILPWLLVSLIDF